MEICHLTKDLIAARRALLQGALRPGFTDYTIEDEYPIVLNPHERQFSWCVVQATGDQTKTLVAHANLWPRVLYHSASGLRFQVGLVGNVATSPAFRGQGIMKQLLDEIWKKAQQAKLEALILWSDLVAFYHKLGYDTCGQERRYYFSAAKLSALSFDYEIVSGGAETLSADLLRQLLSLRYKTPSYLLRSVDEYNTLLQIPDTVLLMARKGGQINGFAIVGKGCDMVGVVHEWGMTEEDALIAILRHITCKTGWEQVGLLAPFNLKDRLRLRIKDLLLREDIAGMALVKTKHNAEVAQVLADGFLWGLDAI